jgi:TP901 family phage tail tape measure protein
MQEIKRQLDNFAKNPTKTKISVDTTRATTALQSIKTQLNSLQGKTVTTYVQTKQKGASAAAKGGGNGGNALADNAGVLAATGAAMVAPLALPVSTAMDFEQAMSKVKAITNSTDEDMARLTATARELGASTQYSATEAAQAMAYLGMAGWKTEEIIKGMPGLLDLAAASGEDLARVSDIVSDDLTAFRMSADQAAHMADVMAAASTNANTNVSMMGETFKYTGAVAGALGYSLEDVAAATGLMANSGIKAEMAGTALRSIMTRLVTPPKEASSAMDMLGISVQNADGTLKSFRQQMIDLRNAFAGLSEAERSEAAKAIAGQEAMAGFLAIVNASDADFNKMTAAVDNSNGAAAKMAETMKDNAKGALKEFKSAIEEIEIIVGNAFLDTLKDATKSMTSFAQEFGKFAKEHPKLVGGIAAAVAAIGSLLVALGGVGLAVSAISTAFEALAPIFTAVGGALSVGLAPILAILAAIATAIYFVGENWDLVVSWFSPALDSMLEGLESLRGAWEAIQPLIVALTPLIQFLAELIGGVIVGALSLMYRWWAYIFSQIAALIEWIAGKLGALGSIIQTLAGGLSGLIDKAAQFIGMEGQISGVNTELTQRIADAAIANGTTINQSQTNYNTFTEPNQWGATNAGNGQFFAYQ